MYTFHHHVSSSPLCELRLWISKHCVDQTTKPQICVFLHMPGEISFFFFLTDCHLFISTKLVRGKKKRQKVFNYLHINTGFIEMHLVLASDSSYTERNVDAFFSFLLPIHKDDPHVSEIYKPNIGSLRSPFHHGYTDEHRVPWCSCYA